MALMISTTYTGCLPLCHSFLPFKILTPNDFNYLHFFLRLAYALHRIGYKRERGCSWRRRKMESTIICDCGCEIDDLVEAYLESLDAQGRSGPAAERIADHAREHGPAAAAAIYAAAEKMVERIN